MKAWSVCLVCAIAILCITGLEFYALHLGHNGMILASAIAIIAGIPAVLITKKVVESKKQ